MLSLICLLLSLIKKPCLIQSNLNQSANIMQSLIQCDMTKFYTNDCITTLLIYYLKSFFNANIKWLLFHKRRGTRVTKEIFVIICQNPNTTHYMCPLSQYLTQPRQPLISNTSLSTLKHIKQTDNHQNI